MTRMRINMLSFLVLVAGTIVLAQKPSDTHPPGKNPHLGNKASIRGGLALYRVRCGDCHGLDARGYRGPDLTAVLGGMTDERLFQTIRKGVPGTEMQPSTAPDDDVLMIIAYLRNMNMPAAGGSADRQRRQRHAPVRVAMRNLPSRGRSRRTARSRSVADRRRAIARRARARDSHAVGMDSGRRTRP